MRIDTYVDIMNYFFYRVIFIFYFDGNCGDLETNKKETVKIWVDNSIYKGLFNLRFIQYIYCIYRI